MLRPRVIPCLLLHEHGLIKTVKFKDHKYVGDPINAIKIFNEKEADELIILDIDTTVNGVEPDYKQIAYFAAECRMPLCYGGGISSAAQAKKIIELGVEKVAISASAIDRPDLITEIADEIGSQSVVVVIDIRSRKLGLGYEVWTHNATRNSKRSPFEVALEVQEKGAGEIVINSIDRDGQMKGYDMKLIEKMRQVITIPMTVLGGCGSLGDMKEVVSTCGVVGVAAGSLFVFKGPYKAVLINYPDATQKQVQVYSGCSG